MFEYVQALLVPFLVVASCLIVLEITFSAVKGMRLYELKDTLCNLGIFALARLTAPLFVGYLYTTLKMLEHFKLLDIQNTAATTFVAVILTDFVYYWEHRWSHTTRFLWFFHEVHHSSKSFNLATSFRLPWLGRLTAPIIFGPLVVIGFKPEQVILFFIANLFYQFVLHTRTIGKLGILEGIVNTPAAHRVHHARNKIYIDKNFGGILMLWDRLFNTYAAETEAPQFGIVGKFESSNPFTVNFHNIPGYSFIAARLTLARASLGVLLTVFFIAPVTGANAQESRAAPLLGQIEVTESADNVDFTGLWKAHVIEFRRHPKLSIDTQVDGHVEGIYSGLLGKFPVSGDIDLKSGSFKLFIDFSKSRVMRTVTSSKAPIAEVDGHINESTIAGIATLPEFGNRIVHIEAKRAPAQD